MWHDKNKKYKKWPKKITSTVTFHKLELATPRNCTEDTCSKIAKNIDNLDYTKIVSIKSATLLEMTLTTDNLGNFSKFFKKLLF